jgi:hypothetical protein
MRKLEQFLKPPSNMNLEEEMYNVSQERDEEINEYNQNEENSYDNGNQIKHQENEDENYENNEELQNSKNKNFKNFKNEEDNNEIIQGINSFNYLINKNIDVEDNENEIENLHDKYNQFNNQNINNNINKNNQKQFLNEIDNNDQTQASPNTIMNDLLFKIKKLKGNRTMKKSDIINSNEFNLNNNFEILKKAVKNDKYTINKNEYIGNLNMNNQIIQNNPKMKEIANLIKDYNQDKNVNDNIQINFYNNNQINIIKPNVFFNMSNQKKQNKENNYDNSNGLNKYYISIIDGKAIVNGQRINVNSGFQTTPHNNLFEKRIDFNDISKNNNKNLFNYDEDRRTSFFENKNKIDFKLPNLKRNYNFNIKNSKNNFKTFTKTNLFTREFYNEELNKIDDSLFNINKERYKIRK